MQQVTGAGVSTGIKTFNQSRPLRMCQGGPLELIPPRESLATSPIFSNTTGFGGNGDPTAPESVGGGHCVTDGPFTDLALPFFDSDDHIHCLSRGFTDGEVRGRLPGDKVQPAMIEEILR
jgi:hypothetical protein